MSDIDADSNTIKVLDHGFVRLVDVMGNDQAIVQAARVSYGKGTKSVNADRGLIRYLLKHQHTTPFEMVE
ncbi:MAG: FAD-dependent thymidylate synthase, partial [Ignavibacteriales bacterium]|nr:FAD-dependent thymidylate synthase [Ignavibacteriales bacterium]